jgi:membrane protein DedA with SNARE-associated domain
MNTALALLSAHKYLALFPLAVVEGPLVSLVVGFLIHKQILSFWLSFLILLLGDIIPDSIFWCIGYYGRGTKMVKKYVLDNKLFANHLNVIERLWTEHTKKTMFLGKLAYGMALPFLISAGVIKMPFKKFITYAVPVSIFQYGTIVLIGYLLGNSYNAASFYVGSIYRVLAIFVILCIVIYYLIIRYARKKIILLVEEEEREVEENKK